MFNDLSTHLENFKKSFFKYKEFRINLNPNMCAFVVFLGTILGFIISKERKTLNPKKNEVLMNMLIPNTL
jgi:hypothetical protein